MASNPEFVQYIADQLAPAGQVTYHKMFGDYGVYLDGKMFAREFDTLNFKKLPQSLEIGRFFVNFFVFIRAILCYLWYDKRKELFGENSYVRIYYWKQK